MEGNKPGKKCSKAVPVLIGAALCLLASVSRAQTPAQDNSKIDKDKAAVEKAKTSVENATLQMNTDQASKKLYALQGDAVALAAAKQAESLAEDKLKADTAQQGADEARFNLPPPPPPAPAGAPQGITIVEPAVPAGTIVTPIIPPGNPPAVTAPANVTVTPK